MPYTLNSISPEQAGIPSQAVSRFLRRMEEKQLPLHSLLLVRNGELFTEAYWKPFHRDFKHRIYSCSKSFVSVATGILIGEGKLSLEDKAMSFFQDKVPENLHPYLSETTIRDLLTMSTPYTFGATYVPEAPDWADTFFTAPISHPPGTIFNYDTTASTMLSMIIKRITGLDFVEYLKPRLFRPIGMSEDIYCIKTPCGYDWGGSGVICTPRDLARFATICLNKGNYQGQQLIPKWYMEQATSKQIDTFITDSEPETCFGYGYQFWCTRHNGFATLGMGGQLSINLPQYGFSLITTGDTQFIPSAYSTIFTTLWDTIFPYLSGPFPLPENKKDFQELEEQIAGLSLVTAHGELSSPIIPQINGKEYILSPNPMKISRIKFSISDHQGCMEYTNGSGDHSISFGFQQQYQGIFPETHYFGRYIGRPSGEGYTYYGSAGWVRPDSLLIRCQIADRYFGQLKINVAFKDNRISVLMQKVAEWFLDEYQGFAAGEQKN